jgi:hypothetical protein
MFQLVIEDTIEQLRQHWLRLLLISSALGVATFVIFIIGFSVLLAGAGSVTTTAGMTPTSMSSAGGTGVAAFSAALQGMLVGLIVMLLLVSAIAHVGLAMMIRTCTEQESVGESLRAAVRQVPYHSSQAGVVGAPFLVPLLVIALTGSPVLGLLLSLLVIPYSFIAAPLYLLLSVECAQGSREWLPRQAWELLRSNLGGSILVSVTLWFAVTAISLVGTLVVFLAIIAAPASTMLLVAGAVALHRSLDGGHRRPAPRKVSPNLNAPSGSPAVPVGAVPSGTAARSQPTHHAHATDVPGLLAYLPHGMQPSQSFTGVLQPATATAEWVGMSIDGVLVLRLTANSGALPSLQLVSQTGVPVPLSDVYPDGGMYAQVSTGWYQAGVGSTSMDHIQWTLQAYQIPLETWNQAMSNASAAAGGGFQQPA